MSKGKHSEAQMIGALKQVEAGRAVEDLAREMTVTQRLLALETNRGLVSGTTTKKSDSLCRFIGEAFLGTAIGDATLGGNQEAASA